MRAWRYEQFGAVADVVRQTDVPTPSPLAGEILVRVRHVSLNPLDWELIEGRFRWFAKSRPPCGIGTEFSGTVAAVGAGVSAPPIGTAVIGFIDPMRTPPGALQECVVADAGNIVAIPADIDAAEACTLSVAGLSARRMCELASVQPGQRVLIHGAAGGVGSFAVQVVRALGALPVATGGAASQAFIASLKPQAQFDYAAVPTQSWSGPFAAVLDCSSTLRVDQAGVLLADGGTWVNTVPAFPGVAWDPIANPFRRIKRRTLRLVRKRGDLDLLLKWVAEGKLKPQIAQRFAFVDALRALELSKTGHTRGKAVVDVS